MYPPKHVRKSLARIDEPDGRMQRSKTADGTRIRHPHNRHEKCIAKALEEGQQHKPVSINGHSQTLARLAHNRPIQDRAKDIMDARNYRLQLERQHREQKQRELEDTQMKREKSISKARKKAAEQIPAKQHLRVNHLADRLRYEEDVEIMKERELLKIAMLREDQLQSSLVARLKQISPYTRRSFLGVEDFLRTRRGQDHSDRYYIPYVRRSLSPMDAYYRYPDRPLSPGFGGTASKAEQSSSPTTSKKVVRKPNELRKVLQANREEIMNFLTDILERRG